MQPRARSQYKEWQDLSENSKIYIVTQEKIEEHKKQMAKNKKRKKIRTDLEFLFELNPSEFQKYLYDCVSKKNRENLKKKYMSLYNGIKSRCIGVLYYYMEQLEDPWNNLGIKKLEDIDDEVLQYMLKENMADISDINIKLIRREITKSIIKKTKEQSRVALMAYKEEVDILRNKEEYSPKQLKALRDSIMSTFSYIDDGRLMEKHAEKAESKKSAWYYTK